MTIHEAYHVLFQHQEWRSGVEDVPMVEPKELSSAIVTILKYLFTQLSESERMKVIQ